MSFYPSISTLLPVESIPDKLGFIKDGITSLFENLYYRDLQVNKTANGEAAFYRLDLLSYNKIGVEVPGTNGLALVFNPDLKVGGTSSFNISLGYRLAILKYVKGFDLQTFDWSPASFLDILLNISGVQNSDLYNQAISIFIDDENPLQVFVDNFNTKHSPTTYLVLSSDPDLDTIGLIKDLIVQMNNNGNAFDLIDVLYNDYVKAATDDQTLSNLEALFGAFLNNFSISNIKDMLVPQASVALNDLAVALEFPRSILKPIDPATKVPYTDLTKLSQLLFTIGSLKFTTEKGLEFDGQTGFHFDKSEIADTGITLSFTDAKVDLSRITNIPEATAAGYSDDFVGVFIGEATVGLPEKWNHSESTSTAEIIGTNLIIGTGGFSGTIAMQAKDPNATTQAIIAANFGGLKVELDAFSITFHKNAVTDSSITGKLTIPEFTIKDPNTGNNIPAVIAIKISFDSTGNFEITAQSQAGVEISFGDAFSIIIREFDLGKKDGKYFIGVGGSLSFNEGVISDILSGDIDIQKIIIWEDGRIEFEGGTIPLPKGASVKLGPATVFVTAICFGSSQVDRNGVARKYNYFGFDGGVNINPGGVDARGTGLKYHFPVDNKKFPDPNDKLHGYITIDSLYISVIVPGDASKDTATAIIEGWLSVSQVYYPLGSTTGKKVDVYAGGISLSLPQLKIAATASISYTPDIPAWIIDLGLELPSPLPLGPTGLGIYGIRGLVGQRYVAAKEALNPVANSWFEYYKAAPKEGVVVQKFETPSDTESSNSPFSVGVGASIATAGDDGKAFSSKLFLLLSLPNLLLIEGKANILGKRVGLDTTQDPPFFAYLAITSQSVETGFGLSYSLPKDSGLILDLKVQMEAAFFFNNPKAWYINFGTKTNPIKANILSIIQGQSYLMMSASGIEMGASAEMGFKKSYCGGTLSAEAKVYIKTDGFISFEDPQIGAHASVGGNVSVSVCGFGFYISLNTALSVEVPKPFKIHGSVDLSVGFRILGKRISKEFTVEFTWEKSAGSNTQYISPLEIRPEAFPVKAINMLSGEVFNVDYIDSQHFPTFDFNSLKIIPMDSFIDIEFKKPVNPSSTDVCALIGGFGTINGSIYKESIPPRPIDYSLLHEYSITELTVKYFDETSNTWTIYEPYKAMIQPVALASTAATLASKDDFKLGHWQLQSAAEYKRIRLLSQTPFSYMQQGQSGWYKPYEYGLTASSVFCVGTEPRLEVANWLGYNLGQKLNYMLIESNTKSSKKILVQTSIEMGTVEAINNVFGLNQSLVIPKTGKILIRFQEHIGLVTLKLSATCNNIKITTYKRNIITPTSTVFTYYIQDEVITKSKNDLVSPITFTNTNEGLRYLIIECIQADVAKISSLEDQIKILKLSLYESNNQNRPTIVQEIIDLEQQIADEEGTEYDGGINDLIIIQGQIDTLTSQLTTKYSEKTVAEATQSRYEELYTSVTTKLEKDCNILLTIPDSPELRSTISEMFNILPVGMSVDEIAVYFNAYIESLRTLNTDLAECSTTYDTNTIELIKKAQSFIDSIRKELVLIKGTNAVIEKEIQDILEKIHRLTTQIQIINTGGSGAEPKSLILHEVDWMSINDVKTLTDFAARSPIQEQTLATVNSIEQSLAPIWRPNTKYLITLIVNDGVKPFTYYFGFKTAGPIGYFHEAYNTQNPSNPYCKNVDVQNHRLTSLREYIDYQRSYPNADGNILLAKPLYYTDTMLDLFYIKSYVFNMLQDWEQYGGNAKIQGNLLVVVKDPIEDVESLNPPPPTVTTTNIPEAQVTWKDDKYARQAKDISVWDILRSPSKYNPDIITSTGVCWSEGGDKIRPASVSTSVTLNYLKPNKLYTVLFYNVFGGQRKEVHRYIFQTSRYSSLEEHVMSYIMKDENGITKEAIFEIVLPLSSLKSKVLGLVALQNKKSGDTILDALYADPFDCLIEGVFKLSPLPPAINHEINLVKNTDSGKVVGLLLRSPEPFINPRLPEDVKNVSIEINKLYVRGYNKEASFCLFSKDCSQVFITNSNFDFSLRKLKIAILNKKWDPKNGYIIADYCYTNEIVIN